jgi:hypothetical protein
MSYYGSTDWTANDDLMLRLKDIRKGNLELDWMKAGTEVVRASAENPRRGFTYLDCNVGAYGEDALPEIPRGPRGSAPRGASYDVAKQADLSPELNRKSDVWAYKVSSFYEEAMSRQWNATTDIPWRNLDHEERPEELEIAFAQLCTFFTEVELIATDLPAKWAWRMNNQFHEVKHFIATQAIDEARHAEVREARAGVGVLDAALRRGIAEGHLWRLYSEAARSCTCSRKATCSRCSASASSSRPRPRTSACSSS